MKKGIVLFVSAFLLVNIANAITDEEARLQEFAGKVDRKPYSCDKKVKILKRLGVEYCIKGENPIWLMGIYNHRLSLGYDGFSHELERGFKKFIDDRTTINDETIYNHFKNSNFSKFYTCLELYDSPEYNAEAKRIMKKRKQCKDYK